MKILKKDLKEGLVSVRPENLDDLWLLKKIISSGDVISGKTLRSLKIQRGDQAVKTERKQIFVKLSAEKIDFNENQLRVSGKIIECSEGERGYHAFEIMINEAVTIQREWTKYDLQRVEDAKVKHPKILICVLDYTECDFAFLTERLSYLTNIRGVSGKSYGEEGTERYFKEVCDYISEKSCDKIIVAGPGFVKDKIFEMLKERGIKNAFCDSVSNTGDNGIQEVLRRGIVGKIMKNSAITEQTMLVEEFFSRLLKGRKVVYGLAEVKKAVDMGAVEKLLISDTLVKDNDALLKVAEKFGAEIKIIDVHHEAGKRLFEIGGIAAFLRYDIS